MGPTFGGYLTDVLNWRWVFYINVPVCFINFFLVWFFIRKTNNTPRAIDWRGVILMCTAVATLQLILDRGQVDDWFNSEFICAMSLVCASALISFLIHSFTYEKPIINLRLFKDKNFAVGCLVMMCFSAFVFGSLTLLPQMLETLFNYTSNLAGITMAPRGIASACMMLVVSKLMMRGIQPRWLIMFGLSVASLTTWYLSCINLDTNFAFFIQLGLISGLGIGCFFVPLTTVVYATLPKDSIAEAAGLFSFCRNIGNAIGISFLTTYLSRQTQIQWHTLGVHINIMQANFQHWLSVYHLSLHQACLLYTSPSPRD